MSEEAETIKKLVVTALEQDHHGVALQGGLVKPLAAYLVGALKVERIPQDLPDTQEEWLKTANEAFEANEESLPGAFETRLRRWLKGDGLKEASAGKETSMPHKSGGGLGSKALGHYDTLAFELGVTPAAVEEQFDDHSVDLHTRAHAVSDMKAQGMPLTQILALTVGLETGKIHPAADVTSFTYGSDIRTSELVTRLKRAGVSTLTSLLKEGKVVPVAAHLNSLLRDFSLHGQMREAALLSSWMQEWQQMLVGEEAVAIAYLTEYFRSYPGRGLPTEFDFRIFFRACRSPTVLPGRSRSRSTPSRSRRCRDSTRSSKTSAPRTRRRSRLFRRRSSAGLSVALRAAETRRAPATFVARRATSLASARTRRTMTELIGRPLRCDSSGGCPAQIAAGRPAHTRRFLQMTACF